MTSIVDSLTIRGGGLAQSDDMIGADDLETLIREIADERIAAGDTRAGYMLERIARHVGAEWPRLETLESELEGARESGSESGYESAAEHWAEVVEDAAALFSRWIEFEEKRRRAPDATHNTGDLMRDTRTWIAKRHDV